MLEGDPKQSALHMGRRYLLPIFYDSVLHPLKVHRVVDLPHLVDIGRRNPDRVVEYRCFYHTPKMGPLGSYNARNATAGI